MFKPVRTLQRSLAMSPRRSSRPSFASSFSRMISLPRSPPRRASSLPAITAPTPVTSASRSGGGRSRGLFAGIGRMFSRSSGGSFGGSFGRRRSSGRRTVGRTTSAPISFSTAAASGPFNMQNVNRNVRNTMRAMRAHPQFKGKPSGAIVKASRNLNRQVRRRSSTMGPSMAAAEQEFNLLKRDDLQIQRYQRQYSMPQVPSSFPNDKVLYSRALSNFVINGAPFLSQGLQIIQSQGRNNKFIAKLLFVVLRMEQYIQQDLKRFPRLITLNKRILQSLLTTVQTTKRLISRRR